MMLSLVLIKLLVWSGVVGYGEIWSGQVGCGRVRSGKVTIFLYFKVGFGMVR